MIAQAQVGSGRTALFVLTMLDRVDVTRPENSPYCSVYIFLSAEKENLFSNQRLL